MDFNSELHFSIESYRRVTGILVLGQKLYLKKLDQRKREERKSPVRRERWSLQGLVRSTQWTSSEEVLLEEAGDLIQSKDRRWYRRI